MSRQAQEGAPSPLAADNTSSRATSNKRTVAQLEKKRAQDRDSQRNVRQRTKQHIAKLEAQVQQLAAPDNISRLMKANEVLQKRNDELTTILRSMSQLANQAVSFSTESFTALGKSPSSGEERSPRTSTNHFTKETYQYLKDHTRSPPVLSPGSTTGSWPTKARPLHEAEHEHCAHRAESTVSNASLASNASGSGVELPNSILRLATEAPDCWCTPSPDAAQTNATKELDSGPNNQTERPISDENGSHFKNHDWLAPDFIGNIRQCSRLVPVQVLTCPSSKLQINKITQRYP